MMELPQSHGTTNGHPSSHNSDSDTHVYAPSHFTPDISSDLIPLDSNQGLSTYSRALTALSIRSTVSLLPPWWQLDALACTSHEQHHIPHATTNPEHLPVAVELVRQLTPQLILSDIDTGYALAEALHLKHVALPPYWYIIEPYESSRTFALPGVTVIHEFDVSPGVPVAYQCPQDLAHAHYTASVETDGKQLYVHHNKKVVTVSLIDLPYPVEEPCNHV